MKLYRGYNSQYNNYGIPSGSNHIWTTDDINYANEYYDSVVEFEIDENELNVADIYDLWEVLGDEEGEFDPIDLDNEEAQALIDNNYNCLIFDTPSDETVYVLLDKKLIKSVRNIDKQDNYNDTINEVLRIAGVTQINESWTDDSDLYDIYEDYQLNEEIVHSEMAIDPEFGDEYMKIILKNPTRQELYKEDMTFCRVLEDNKGNFYFADAYLYVHWEMEEELSSYGAYSQEMFYDYHKNLFMQRQDEYEDENLLAKEAKETEKSLRKNSYISSTFGNFKYEAIFGEPLGY